MNQEGKFSYVKKWTKDWYPTFAVCYYAIVIISAILAGVTLIVNFTNRSEKSFSSVVSPLGGLLSPSSYYFLLEYRWPILAMTSLLIVSAFLGAIAVIDRRLSSLTLLDDVARQYREFLSKLRDFTIESMQHGKMDDVRYDYYKKRMYAETEQFFRSSINAISVLFGTMTGNRCHVSIKLFDPMNNSVKTVARDELSTDNRSASDEHLAWYDYKENSAFEKIIDGAKTGYFLSNHLYVNSLIGTYKNANPKWKDLYNACLVVPITSSTHPSAITRTTVLGFLCVDNRAGGFDPKVGRAVLQSFARMYHFVLIASAATPNQ